MKYVYISLLLITNIITSSFNHINQIPLEQPSNTLYTPKPTDTNPKPLITQSRYYEKTEILKTDTHERKKLIYASITIGVLGAGVKIAGAGTAAGATAGTAIGGVAAGIGAILSGPALPVIGGAAIGYGIYSWFTSDSKKDEKKGGGGNGDDDKDKDKDKDKNKKDKNKDPEEPQGSEFGPVGGSQEPKKDIRYYLASPKHHQNSTGNISKSPSGDAQKLLDTAKTTQSDRLINVDKTTGEYVVFPKTGPMHYHGYATKDWKSLDPKLQKDFYKSGLVSNPKTGKIA